MPRDMVKYCTRIPSRNWAKPVTIRLHRRIATY